MGINHCDLLIHDISVCKDCFELEAVYNMVLSFFQAGKISVLQCRLLTAYVFEKRGELTRDATTP